MTQEQILNNSVRVKPVTPTNSKNQLKLNSDFYSQRVIIYQCSYKVVKQ